MSVRWRMFVCHRLVGLWGFEDIDMLFNRGEHHGGDLRTN